MTSHNDGGARLGQRQQDAQRGSLLVFRQDHPEDTVEVALRGVRGDGTHRVIDALSSEVVGTWSADGLRAGIPVTLAERHTAAVWFVDRA